MADIDRNRIRPPENSSDHTPWRILVKADCSPKRLDGVMETSICAKDSELAKEEFKKR